MDVLPRLNISSAQNPMFIGEIMPLFQEHLTTAFRLLLGLKAIRLILLCLCAIYLRREGTSSIMLIVFFVLLFWLTTILSKEGSYGSNLPWVDILLLQPVYPIASNQYRLHGQEEKALALCVNFPELYKYLIDQPSNSIEKTKNNKPTMVRAMALLRNILAHEQSNEWKESRRR